MIRLVTLSRWSLRLTCLAALDSQSYNKNRETILNGRRSREVKTLGLDLMEVHVFLVQEQIEMKQETACRDGPRHMSAQ